MNKTLKRLLSTVLVLMLLFALCAPALASTTVYATTALNLRSGPGTNYSIVGGLSMGQAATKVGSSGKWYKLNIDGQIVYGHKSYLSTKAPSGVITGTTSATGNVQATTNLNLRSGPSTKYSIEGFLAKGDYAMKTGSTGTWSQLSYNGKTVYASSKYLRDVAYTGTTPSTPQYTKVYALAPVNVFSEPYANSRILGSLYAGQGVDFRGYQGTYTIIGYNGTLGYVQTTMMSTMSSAAPTTNTITSPNTAIIRAGAGDGYSVIGYLYPGSTATRTGIYGDWTQILFNGVTGYVRTSSVNSTGSALNPSTSPSGYLHAIVRTYVYDGPSTANQKLGFLEVGQSLPYTGTVGAFAALQYGNRVAYVLIKDTSLAAASAAANMTPYNGYMFARSSYTKVYTAPIESDTYRMGYLDANEAINVTATNSVWAQFNHNGRILYVPLKNLSATYGGSVIGGYPYGNYSATVTYNYNPPLEIVLNNEYTMGYTGPDASNGQKLELVRSDLVGASIRVYCIFNTRRARIVISGASQSKYNSEFYIYDGDYTIR